MKNPIVLIVVAVVVILKLIITGLCLAIGFRLGGKVYDKLESEWNKKQPVPTPEPEVQQAV